ncbi:MAG: adenylate/guanylate cyclase domain-containing protein [Polaromonas sp.]|nr:adenylate/guanylate cyclase domain-containing protein [Polaromonas sp.]
MSQLHRIHTSGSQERLDRLIQERLEPGADKARIDQRIWDLFGEDWCVMFTDLAGFSRRVEEFGIIHFLQIIHESERLLIPVIEDHEGILLKLLGDSFLVIFRNPHKALKCALGLQQLLAKYNLDRLPQEQVLLCVGLGYGRVLRIGDSDVFGAEVNAASKLGEDMAKGGEILVTGAFRHQCGDLAGTSYVQIAHPPAGTASAFRVMF